MFSTSIFIRQFSSGLLSGTRVLDLTRVLAGPFCTMLLADLGAEVIKVEKPNTGDETRNWGPLIGNHLSCYFVSINRNKKSIVVDMKKQKGIDLIKDLAKKSDVFVENYVPGKLDRLGLGYEDIKKINPSIVYCSITGFGSTGPYSQRSGYDVIAASIGGLLSITGPEHGDPCKVGIAMTDLSTGLYAKSAILCGLLKKHKSDLGCKIDCDLLSTQVSLLTHLAANYLNCADKPRRRGTEHENIVPYKAYQCQDSNWITIGVGSDQMFDTFCDILELSHLKHDPRFQTNTQRVRNRASLYEIVSSTIISHPVRFWLDKFQHTNIPFGQVNEIDQVFQDEQVLHNNQIVETIHPNAGPIKTLFTPVKYQSDEEILNKKLSPPPSLGQHTEEILTNILNYENSKIKLLKEEKVI